MKDFSRGVSYYTNGKVDIGFPENDIACRWCPMLGMELKYNRAYCRKTGEYLTAPEYTIGYQCPIVIEVDESEG